MRKYELLLILPGTLDEREAGVKSREIMEIVKSNGSEPEIVSLGKNRLAYPVKQIRYGYFFVCRFNAEPEGVKNIQAKLALMRDLLRSDICLFDAKWSASQKIAYATSDTGATVMKQTSGQAEAVRPEEAKADLKDIDRRLDEILNTDIIINV